ncbi:MAG TPA: sigma-70 family RNA polymerase sigma factor [Ktedonobacteraceae bacterium]|nr:sigma-70 family RNA polymerase sigma factor [Ktedonobacteraceae bacterium]
MQGRDSVTPLTSEAARARQQLLECVQENTVPLLGSIHAYVMRMGLASGQTAREIADEVLQETVVEALAHAENYRSGVHPMAWLRGVALNVIRRKRANLMTRAHRELPMTHLVARYPDLDGEQALLEQLGPVTEHGPEQELESNEQAAELLALVSSEDQHVLTLALLEGFESSALAQRLGTAPNAARMRLHRALTRLRTAWFKRAKNQTGDTNHA